MRSERRYLALQIVRRAADNVNKYDHDITKVACYVTITRYQHYFFRGSALIALASIYRSVNDRNVALLAFNKVRSMFKGILFSSVTKLFSLRIS